MLLRRLEKHFQQEKNWRWAVKIGFHMNTEILKKKFWQGFLGKNAALTFCFVIDFDRGMTCLHPCQLGKCLRLPDWTFFLQSGTKVVDTLVWNGCFYQTFSSFIISFLLNIVNPLSPRINVVWSKRKTWGPKIQHWFWGEGVGVDRRRRSVGMSTLQKGAISRKCLNTFFPHYSSARKQWSK